MGRYRFLFLLLLLGAATALPSPADHAWAQCTSDAMVCSAFLFRYDGMAGVLDAQEYYRSVEGASPIWAPHWLEHNVTTVDQLFGGAFASEALIRYRGVLNSAMGSCNHPFEDPMSDGTRVVCVCQEGEDCSKGTAVSSDSGGVAFDSALVITSLVVALIVILGMFLGTMLAIVCTSPKL